MASLDSATLWSAIESAAEQASIGVYIAQIDVEPPRILYVNARGAEIVGQSAATLIGDVPWSILRVQDQAIVQGLIERPPGAPAASMELVVQRPDGTQVPIALASTRISTTVGTLSLGYFRDITSERETLAALRRSEERFRFLVESAPDGVVILKRGLIVFINPKASHMLGVGIDGAIGKPISSFLPPADAAIAGARIGAMLRDGVEFPPSEYNVLADPMRVVEIKSTVCEWDGEQAVLALARDVTERKAIERRLVESDRLAALGTLAAGVAHEINNPLTYAQISAQRIARILQALALPEELMVTLRGLTGDIEHGIKRVASITQSLRAFVAYNDDDAAVPVDLQAVLARAIKMVANDIRHVARLVHETTHVPFVVGSTPRLEQVFVNLLINALKALPASPPKQHEIVVSVEHLGDHVTVAIRDTGCGIPAALRGRIFDPFFTTRDVGHGMGLGLSVSKSIVEKYGGQIEVESTENIGTTVSVHLRVHPGTASTVEADAVADVALPRLRVLVIDDESMICEVLSRILCPDHEVSVARTGEEALALLATASFNVILCDVMMPGMNGLDVYRRVAADQPGSEQRIVFMSGGTMGSGIENALSTLPNGHLTKPFKIERVLEVVRTYYVK